MRITTVDSGSMGAVRADCMVNFGHRVVNIDARELLYRLCVEKSTPWANALLPPEWQQSRKLGSWGVADLETFPRILNAVQRRAARCNFPSLGSL